MKNFIFIFSILVLFLYSCNSNEEQEENQNQDDTVSYRDYTVETEIDTTQLIIEGENIWVRNKPIAGEVIMKLNSGDVCKIIEVSDEDQVRDIFDYWYKIEFNNKVGWVFGAQTNKKSREIHDIIPFETYFEEIALKYDGKTKDMFMYEHKEIPFTLLYNIGAYCTEYSTDNSISELSEDINSENIFNKKPKGEPTPKSPIFRNHIRMP